MFAECLFRRVLLGGSRGTGRYRALSRQWCGGDDLPFLPANVPNSIDFDCHVLDLRVLASVPSPPPRPAPPP